MTAYEEGLPVQVAFPPETARSLAQAFSEAGWRQAHIAETEKYAHVTYFFNGGVETPWPGEDRVLVPSPDGGDLRPRAGDARGRRHRRAGRGHRVGRLRLHRRQLRQPGHGRPHRHVGRDARGPGRGRCRLARVVGAIEARDTLAPDGPGALLAITADHGNADDLRDADGRAGDGPFAQPGPAPPRRPRDDRPHASDDGVLADVAPTLLELAGLPSLGRDDRSIAARRDRRPRPDRSPCGSIRRRTSGGRTLVNPILAIGQIIVSIALIAAILLQARGTGLSGTFGGDSAVYRSRRGVERRLWQFTIVLARRCSSSSRSPPTSSRPPPSADGRPGQSRRPSRGTQHGASMTRIDAVVVGTLVVLLAVVAGLIGVPAFVPSSASPSPTVDASGRPGTAGPYVEGVLGAPVSVSPAHRPHPRPTVTSWRWSSAAWSGTARTARSSPTWRVLVGRSGRRGCGPSTSARTPIWHDGVPVTADDVVFTIRTLQDPAYAGPSATSWSEVRRRGARCPDRHLHAGDAARRVPRRR